MGGAGAPAGGIKEFERYLKEVAENIIAQEDNRQSQIYLLPRGSDKECKKILHLLPMDC